MNKICKKCNINYSLKSFYTHKSMKDGYLNICKKCTRLRVMIHRENNLERIRAYDLARAKLIQRKEKSILYLKWYRKANPQRYKAQTALGNAIRDGKIIRSKKCKRCLKTCKTEGHHQDYSEPLNVIWLCSVCHKDLHFHAYKECRG